MNDTNDRTVMVLQQAEARIAALEAELSDWRDGDARGVMLHLDSARDRIAALEARVAGLDEAIEYYEIGVTAVGVPHKAERKILHDCVEKARELRASTTLKGGDNG